MKRCLASIFILCAAGSCGTNFTPASVINSLRVIGMRSDPAELAPGDNGRLSSLVVDPSRPGQANSLVWLACDPDPLDLNRSPCSNLLQLRDPSLLLPQDGGLPTNPPGMHFIGFNDKASYTVPPDVFAQLAPNDPRRQVGTVVQYLVLAVGSELTLPPTNDQLTALYARILDNTVPWILVIYRVKVSEESPPNLNPVLGPLLVDGVPLPDGATFRTTAGGVQILEQTAPDSSFESYVEQAPDGTLTPTQETLIGAYFSTYGALNQESIALRSGTLQTFTGPDGSADNPTPSRPEGTLWVVVRDSRGGQAWVQYPMFLCDPALPAPSFSGLSPDTGSANGTTSIVVQGQHLDSILDVLVGGEALLEAAFSPVNQDFEGLVPVLSSGDYPVTVRGRNCKDYPTGLVFHAR